jgi:hypothetical protein
MSLVVFATEADQGAICRVNVGFIFLIDMLSKVKRLPH